MLDARGDHPGDECDSDAQTERYVAMMNRHQVQLVTYVESLGLEYQTALDLVQETNLILWRKRHHFRVESSFWAWACKIAYHQVLHHRRSQSRDKLVFSEEVLKRLADVSQTRLEFFGDHQRQLRLCLQELSPRQQSVIQWRYQQDTAVGSIADRLSTTPNAVSKLLQRARLALIACVQRRIAVEAGQ
ncbi:sigma-70 family RNA polymerase sigma factor [Aporhodopirellula aestuarii]|uniref:Sigma-70 family RNA polymerase sigma factor n=1 Tax=Aporhodopirellula aestuarii TaxID=2950107 RepID=A0ABT0TY41_9BACT|nr:sigma-70 family RNA polymerase sigma factor [Aporhodopirellula aestuarii]MCM2369499.1 sigma-70 family RNA polymerase sigma factor [Aporhodopirellula aestuarii]